MLTSAWIDFNQLISCRRIFTDIKFEITFHNAIYHHFVSLVMYINVIGLYVGLLVQPTIHKMKTFYFGLIFLPMTIIVNGNIKTNFFIQTNMLYFCALSNNFLCYIYCPCVFYLS